jgi:hypothetical protein
VPSRAPRNGATLVEHGFLTDVVTLVAAGAAIAYV